jgi:hypothetical protein
LRARISQPLRENAVAEQKILKDARRSTPPRTSARILICCGLLVADDECGGILLEQETNEPEKDNEKLTHDTEKNINHRRQILDHLPQSIEEAIGLSSYKLMERKPSYSSSS